jgi:hypothetical protein
MASGISQLNSSGLHRISATFLEGVLHPLQYTNSYEGSIPCPGSSLFFMCESYSIQLVA